MSEIKLFRLTANMAAEIPGTATGLEKSLQILIEKNLDAMLGIRMPAVLEVEDVGRWLKEPEAALLRPAADGVLTAHRVSTRVNSTRNNDAALVEQASEPPPPAQAGLFG